jgi:hypothetical protein
MNMAIMDIPTVKPLAAALPQLLKKDGKYANLYVSTRSQI